MSEEGAVIDRIHLHQPAISSVLIRRAIADGEVAHYPTGSRCANCGKESFFLPHMWPIEFVCHFEDGPMFSMYSYACSERCAGRYILNFWTEDQDGPDLTVDFARRQ